MSYNLRVRFKNNMQRPQYMDHKRIALIEHFFKRQIPARKDFLEHNSLYPEKKIGKTTFLNSTSSWEVENQFMKGIFLPAAPARLMRNVIQ